MADTKPSSMSKAEVHTLEETGSAGMESAKREKALGGAGNVQLILNNETVLIPTPSPDPKDPLNLPSWRKWAILILVSVFGSVAIILSSGMGAIITAVKHSYPGEEERTNDLLTYPTLFMGIGNIFAMPLAVTIGRRPIFLITMITLVASGIGCALAPNLSAHIAFRNLMSMAAGQSEALCPLVVQEIYFLHERGRKIGWFVFIENVIAGIFFVTSPYMVQAGGNDGWRLWYWIYTIINAVVLVLSYFLLTETMYERPEDASQGAVHLDFNSAGEVDPKGDMHRVIRVTTKHGNVLEPERFGPRTWKQDLKIFSIKPKWSRVGEFWVDIAKGLLVPTMLWQLLLNGAFLGLYIVVTAVFAGILIPPPYSWSFTSLGYVFVGQVICAVIFLPLLGYGNDFVIKVLSKMHGGMYKPEFRFFNLVIPVIVGVVCGVMFGQAGAFPQNYHWSAVVVTFNGVFFAFLGVNVVGITYAVDAFPLKAGPFLVLICAGRGLISFALSYSVLPAVAAIGYNGTMNVESIVAGVLGAMAIPFYFFGPKIRLVAHKRLRTGGAGNDVE